VQGFDDVSELDEDKAGYWISKKWIKGKTNQAYPVGSAHKLSDWRLLKPKMHKTSQEDPAPDSLEYRGAVWCEHGSLALNSLNRRRISVEVR
jgi:ubiquitin carboxyl-terminal hydrolase 48